jgi:hypothetical protein
MLKKENMTAICRPGALSVSSVPKTIADAMSLVLNMGEHFLWVGSLCIVQDDIKDKRTQRPQMASIFRGGLFTIIAGHGNTADASLPGISSPRRDLNVAHLNGISISETQAPFDCHPITDTPWNSRGWTFQENIASRHRLIFLESSIMWSCLTTDRAEEVDLEAKDTEFHFTEGGRYVMSRVNLKFPVGSYPGLVAEYSQRDLTNQSDAYDAFGLS